MGVMIESLGYQETKIKAINNFNDKKGHQREVDDYKIIRNLSDTHIVLTSITGGRFKHFQ